MAKLHEVMAENPYGTIYITGPMTGKRDFNKPAFDRVRDALRAMYKNANIVSPPDLDGEGVLPWEACLARDLKIVVDAVALVAMEGHRSSRGARLEMYVAQELGIPVYRFPSFRKIA